MSIQVNLSAEHIIAEIVERTFATYQMTKADQEKFMQIMLSKGSLGVLEQQHVNRIFDGLRSGRIRIV
jgi:tellurite resistance protein